MSVSNDHISKLKEFGYSNDMISQIMTLYLRYGKIDILEYYLSGDGVKTIKDGVSNELWKSRL